MVTVLRRPAGDTVGGTPRNVLATPDQHRHLVAWLSHHCEIVRWGTMELGVVCGDDRLIFRYKNG